MTLTNNKKALLRPILENPSDIGLRLFYADELQQAGEEDRAEFIRVQCRIAELEAVRGMANPNKSNSGRKLLDALRRRERELWNKKEIWDWHGETRELFSRGLADGEWREMHSCGFADTVRCTLEEFVGGEKECPNFEDSILEPDTNALVCCRQCDNTGMIQFEGIAADLFAQQPVRNVVITDREPNRNDKGWYWYVGHEASYNCSIPKNLRDDRAKGYFKTREEALEYFQLKCLNYGRSVANIYETKVCKACSGEGCSESAQYHDYKGVQNGTRCDGSGQIQVRVGLPPISPRG